MGAWPASALTYDAFDRLRVAVDDDDVATATTVHVYGADGQRTATRWPDGTFEQRPSAETRVVGDASGALTHLTWHVGLGGARQVAQLATPVGGSGLPAGVAPVVYLHQGFGPGTTLVTGADGQMVEERQFEPFGASLLASADYLLELHGWNAKPVDPWREWSDHGARWHATSLGRWTAADPPLRHPKGLLEHGLAASTYGFVAGNPVGFWDPDGLDDDPVLGASRDILFWQGALTDARAQTHFTPEEVARRDARFLGGLESFAVPMMRDAACVIGGAAVCGAAIMFADHLG